MDAQDRLHHQTKTEPISSIGTVSNPIDLFGKIVVGVVVLEILLMVILNIYENSRLNTLNSQLSNDQATLATDTYATMNSQVNDILAGQDKLSGVLNSKLSWSKFYSALNAITPKNVSLTDITLNQDGTFKADGQASSLATLAQALTAWGNGVGTVKSPFNSVTLNSEGYSTGNSNNRFVSFSISGGLNLGELR